jgi:hypothetical protein
VAGDKESMRVLRLETKLAVRADWRTSWSAVTFAAE